MARKRTRHAKRPWKAKPVVNNDPAPWDKAATTITRDDIAKVMASLDAGPVDPKPYIVTEAQRVRFLGEGMPEHRMQVSGRIPVVDVTKLVGLPTRQRASRDFMQQFDVIEPLDAGLKRILSRG